MLIFTDNVIDNRAFPCVYTDYKYCKLTIIKELYNSLDPSGNSYCID